MICPGAGKCHGCLRWCDTCGDAAAHTCEFRETALGCGAHPPRAALLDAVTEAKLAVDDAEMDLAQRVGPLVAARRALASREIEWAGAEGRHRSAVGALELALERLRGLSTYAPR